MHMSRSFADSQDIPSTSYLYKLATRSGDGSTLLGRWSFQIDHGISYICCGAFLKNDALALHFMLSLLSNHDQHDYVMSKSRYLHSLEVAHIS